MHEVLRKVSSSEVVRRDSEFLSLVRPLAATFSTSTEIHHVAVVGNQPLSESPERAHQIDSADLVVRVNGFRLDQASTQAAGRRADIVVFNRGVRPTPWFFQGYRDRLYLLIEPGRMHWEPEQYPHFWPRDLGFVTVPNREIIVPLNETIGLDALRDAQWATTGTTAVWIAAALFPDAKLDIAGFSFIDEPNQQAWEHAYGDACIVGPEHRIADEGQFLREWITEGRARYLR